MTVVSIGIKVPYSYASYQQHMEQLREWVPAPRVYSCWFTPTLFYDSPLSGSR